MSGSNGSSRTGFNPAPNHPRFVPPSQFQANQNQTLQPTPRVHFVHGNQEEAVFRRSQPLAAGLRNRHIPEGVISSNYQSRPPFSRSLSSKMFEFPERSPLHGPGRRFRAPSPPINRWRSSGEAADSKNQLFHSLPGMVPRVVQPDVLDKGVQCERDTSTQGSPKPRGLATLQTQQQQQNPLLSALLAAANATTIYPEQQHSGSAVRRSIRGRPPGSLPYWSDSEVNAYDTLEAFSSTNQVGGKQYHAASAVAAAAAAAAVALAGLQSTSNRLSGPRVIGPSTPASVSIITPTSLSEELVAAAGGGGGGGQDMSTMYRNLANHFAETSLYSRFPVFPPSESIAPTDLSDHRKSGSFELLQGGSQDAYSKSQPLCRPVEKNQQPPTASTHFGE